MNSGYFLLWMSESVTDAWQLEISFFIDMVIVKYSVVFAIQTCMHCVIAKLGLQTVIYIPYYVYMSMFYNKV